MQVLGELHNQNGVLCGKADDGDQAHLEVHVIGQSHGRSRQHRAQRTDRHDQHDCGGNAPAFVQGHQQQEHHHNGQCKELGRLRACSLFLVGQCGPFIAYAGWHLAHDAFELGHGFTRGVTRLGIPRNAEGRVAVVARNLHRPHLPVHRSKRGKRHLLPLRVGHIQTQQVFRRHARFRIGLHHHALQTTRIRKLVDHRRPVSRGKRRADGRKAHALSLGLAAVDIHAQLGSVFEVFHHGIGDHRRRVGFLQQLVTCGNQRLAAQTGAVLQPQRKATGITETINGRRLHSHGRAIRQTAKTLVESLNFV